ncbi:MAG TPA: DUF615 domain-containing protein [Polyangiaceae bacterium]|jgi:ribosomal 50S subunit-associated protein YjgA (DUF615 family)|nr:DUF615 domain-containing protein [Polyangiaceae bacterium]
MRRRDTESSPEPVEDLTSRTDVKRANRAVEETLARLSLALAEIAPRRLPRLELPDKVYETVLGVHAMKNARARQRQLGLVRVALRNADWAAIQERIRYYAEGRTLPGPELDATGPALGSTATWVTRLLGEGFAGLDAFLTEYPRTDRARLVDLVHRVDRSTGPQRDKAERKLNDAVAVILASRR